MPGLNKSVRPMSSVNFLIPRDAMISRASCPTIKGYSNPTATASNSNKRKNGGKQSSATMKRKLIRCSGWPVNFFRSSGSCFPALATRWQAHILVQILNMFKLPVPISSVLFRCTFSIAENWINKHIQISLVFLGPRYCTKANKGSRKSWIQLSPLVLGRNTHRACVQVALSWAGREKRQRTSKNFNSVAQL